MSEKIYSEQSTSISESKNDIRVDLKFFPNFTSVSDDTENIKEKLSERLQISSADINVQYITEGSERKYSTEHQEEREYHYRFYIAEFEHFDHYNEDTFNVEGVHYEWMTIDNMLQDPALKEHNEFVIQMVRDHT